MWAGRRLSAIRTTRSRSRSRAKQKQSSVQRKSGLWCVVRGTGTPRWRACVRRCSRCSGFGPSRWRHTPKASRLRKSRTSAVHAKRRLALVRRVPSVLSRTPRGIHRTVTRQTLRRRQSPPLPCVPWSKAVCARGLRMGIAGRGAPDRDGRGVVFGRGRRTRPDGGRGRGRCRLSASPSLCENHAAHSTP